MRNTGQRYQTRCDLCGKVKRALVKIRSDGKLYELWCVGCVSKEKKGAEIKPMLSKLGEA